MPAAEDPKQPVVLTEGGVQSRTGKQEPVNRSQRRHHHEQSDEHLPRRSDGLRQSRRLANHVDGRHGRTCQRGKSEASQICQIDEQIEPGNQQQASGESSRDVPLSVTHLGRDKDGIIPAAVRVQNEDHRQAKVRRRS